MVGYSFRCPRLDSYWFEVSRVTLIVLDLRIKNKNCHHSYLSHGYSKSRIWGQTTQKNITAKRRRTWNKHYTNPPGQCSIVQKPYFQGEVMCSNGLQSSWWLSVLLFFINMFVVIQAGKRAKEVLFIRCV